MAEIDIDKLLEKKEKQEQDRKKTELLKKGLIFGGIGAAAALIIVIIVMILLGESSAAYFPLDNTEKYVYNKKNKSPEEWQMQKKTAMVGEYECKVLNKIDKGYYFSVQEYYVAGKKGIIRLAVSKDYGQKKEDKMRLLPERLKTGLEFDAGSIKNTPITGTVAETDELSTPVGECKAYRVEYRAGNYVNMDVWYGKGIGVIKYTDRVTGDQLDLVSGAEK
jgi:hypothetical protein